MDDGKGNPSKQRGTNMKIPTQYNAREQEDDAPYTLHYQEPTVVHTLDIIERWTHKLDVWKSYVVFPQEKE